MNRKPNKSKKPVARKSPPPADTPPSDFIAESPLTAEYKEYMQRYALYGEGRPQLSPHEFDALDDELLELLALDVSHLTDEQVVRLQELEYLLIDSE